MSTTNLKIPQISSTFGKIDKVIWFSVSNINGTYTVKLFITPSQSFDFTVEIFNYVTKDTHFKKVYKKSSNSSIINETIKIKHTPTISSPIYGLKTF
jgi:hypothetical protein